MRMKGVSRGSGVRGDFEARRPIGGGLDKKGAGCVGFEGSESQRLPRLHQGR
jgi:hypothetical protein